MKATNSFKTVIKNHLNTIASDDSLFAKTLSKKSKNIDDCITYILNKVKASGCNGFADEEIFNMAIHYYDEDDIKVGKPISAKVVVNHSSEKPKKVNAVTKPAEKKGKVVKMDPGTQVSIFDFPDV